MTSVLILLYLADLSEKLQPTLGIISVFSAIIFLCWKFFYFNKETSIVPSRKLLWTICTCIPILIVMPSPGTFYMFAGAETAQTIVTSDIGKKVLDGLNKTIISYSKKSNE